MELDLKGILLEFSVLFASICAISFLFKRLRIPVVLAPVLFGVIMQYTPFSHHLESENFRYALGILSDFGVIFLLFYIGIQLNLRKFKQFEKPIFQLTAYSIVFPFLFGFLFMWSMGYGLFLAFIIGLSRIPVAEAVVVPILDEFKLLNTKVGQFILSPGILDDVIEVLLITVVSIWLANYFGSPLEIHPFSFILKIFSFVFVAWISYRWLIPFFGKKIYPSLYTVMIFCIAILLLFSSFAKFSNLGLVIGSLVAGIAIRPWLNTLKFTPRKIIIQMIEVIAYGFTGIFFFYKVGLLVNPQGIALAPLLAIGLFLSGTLGKLGSALLMVPSKTLTLREAILVGMGLDVRMTTELIIATMLFTAGAIQSNLYAALIAASSLSMISVPVTLSILLKKWRRSLNH